MHCPRCQSVGLHTGKSDAMTVHACGRCGGVWLSPADAARLLQWVTVQPWQEPVQVACAVCKQTMHGKYVSEASVVVDECTEHGYWFDQKNEIRVAAVKPVKMIPSGPPSRYLSPNRRATTPAAPIAASLTLVFLRRPHAKGKSSPEAITSATNSARFAPVSYVSLITCCMKASKVSYTSAG